MTGPAHPPVRQQGRREPEEEKAGPDGHGQQSFAPDTGLTGGGTRLQRLGGGIRTRRRNERSRFLAFQGYVANGRTDSDEERGNQCRDEPPGLGHPVSVLRPEELLLLLC